MHIYTYTHIHIYTHTHTHIYIQIHTYTYAHIHIHTYIYTCIHTYTHIHIGIYIHTNMNTCKLFIICFENRYTQISHHVATSQLSRDKSQITGLHKMRDTRAGNPRTESSNKSELK